MADKGWLRFLGFLRDDPAPPDVYLAGYDSDEDGDARDEATAINLNGGTRAPRAKAAKRAEAPRFDGARDACLCLFDGAAGTFAAAGGGSAATVKAAEADPADQPGARCSVLVEFLDNSSVRVDSLETDSAAAVMHAALAKVGVRPDQFASFGLYEVALGGGTNRRLGRRVAPQAQAPAVAATRVAVAARLFTSPLVEAAVRGFALGADAAALALSRLVYAQAVSAVMSGCVALPDGAHRLETAPHSAAVAVSLRLGALRLFSKALDVADTLGGAGARLVEVGGVAAFVPEAALRKSTMTNEGWVRALLAEFARLVEVDAMRIVGDATETAAGPPDSADTEAAGAGPFVELGLFERAHLPRADGSVLAAASRAEACYVDIISQLPLFGSALFGCADATRHVKLRATPLKAKPAAHTAASPAAATPAARQPPSPPSPPPSAWSVRGPRHSPLGAAAPAPAFSAGASPPPLRLPRRAVHGRSASLPPAPAPRCKTVLAVSWAGVAIVNAEDWRVIFEVKFSRLRRWRAASGKIHFESERPFDAWPEAARARRSAMFGENARDDASTTGEAPPTSPPDEASKARIGALDDEDVEAAMQRMAFVLELGDSSAGSALTLPPAAEVLNLLDDYALFDLAFDRPRCEYESQRAVPREKAAEDMLQPTFPRTQRASLSPPLSSKAPTSEVYDALVGAVVRPPRFVYDVRLLGPSSFVFGGIRYARHDVVLRNARGLRLHCSHWRAAGAVGPRPCVVFMHANSASRVQACNYLSVVLALGCSLFALDCAGSGLSDGLQVSLGWREARDLAVAVRHLKAMPEVSSVAVWGHSMGAAAVVYYHALEPPAPELEAAVLDSPYSDFADLARHLVREHSAVFGGALGMYAASLALSQLALTMALDYVDAHVERVAGFSPVRDLVPARHAAQCSAPALFMRARGDKIVTLAHVEAVANAYAGPRKLALVDGTHSSPRNGAARRFIATFLSKHLTLPPDRERPDARARDRYIEAAPWQRHRTALPSTAAAPPRPGA
ncbi:hypothetical protein M885DRAFT_561604 [Pelagophyceae sp. CCMP2097]|nr:hypothetical protein M885DRAFT_561604 [Pelagophyceae sp. CCMP2097]